MTDDITTKAGFIARSRKAFAAGFIAFAGAAGPATVAITADGQVSLQEGLLVGVVALGIGLGAFWGVWATPNAA